MVIFDSYVKLPEGIFYFLGVYKKYQKNGLLAIFVSGGKW